MSGSVRARSEPGGLSGGGLVRQSDAGGCRGNRRLSHCGWEAGGAAVDAGVLHQYRELRASGAARIKARVSGRNALQPRSFSRLAWFFASLRIAAETLLVTS